MNAKELITKERERQKTLWSTAHDDSHVNGELAMGAFAYINESINWWPDCWGKDLFRPTTRKRNLEKAGAFLLADKERLERALNNVNIDLELTIRQLETELLKEDSERCNVPPPGWECSREVGHDGPCAASKQF